MNDSTKPIFKKLVIAGIILLLILLMQPMEVLLFSHKIDVLFPKGWIGLKERNLMLFIQVLMLIFIIPVYIFTFLFSWWYRADNKKSVYDPHLVDNRLAEVIWWGIPFIMVVFVAVVTVIKTHELDPFKPIESEKKAITIEVVSLQWKWLFIYPDEKIATVNYLRIPKDTPIHFQITSDAPMNSFWIPSLGGQVYSMPGMKTQLYLIADEEGKFRGSSANISGKGFAGMTFVTEATSEESYQEWVKNTQKSEKNLNWNSYEKLAEPSENNAVELYTLKDETLFKEIILKYVR